MVEIPDDVAKQFAAALRSENTSGMGLTAHDRDHLADLLDPQPPTLREQVLGVIRAAWYSDDSTPEGTADAVLAVVADWLAAQPKIAYQPMWSHSTSVAMQRDHDVRLIRGGGDRG